MDKLIELFNELADNLSMIDTEFSGDLVNEYYHYEDDVYDYVEDLKQDLASVNQTMDKIKFLIWEMQYKQLNK